MALDDLIEERAIIINRVNSALKFAKTAKRGDSEQLKSRKSSLKELSKEFFRLQTDIRKLESASSSPSDNDKQVEEFDNLYHNAMSELQAKLKKYEILPLPVTNAAAPNIKLPVVSLPSFDGQRDKWLPFYNTFKSLVADNADLDEYQKLHYLKSALEGEALRAVDSISISSGSYASALAILVNRYNNTRLIVQDYIQAILNATSINKTSHVQLRQLLDTMTNNLESLKNLKMPTDG